jgi:hypothetical protein
LTLALGDPEFLGDCQRVEFAGPDTVKDRGAGLLGLSDLLHLPARPGAMNDSTPFTAAFSTPAADATSG